MKNLKIGTIFLIIGSILFFLFTIFSGIQLSDFDKFFCGLLIGAAIATYIVGIIFIIIYICKNKNW